MLASQLRVLPLLVIIFVCWVGLLPASLGQSFTGAHRRFEYKLSFKGPNLVQRDGTIPFWEHFGRTQTFFYQPFAF